MSVEECPNCGAPLRDGKCNYCQATELGKGIWNEGKCRNCGANLHGNLIKDKENQFVCRYCGWPVRDKPIEDTLKPAASTPSDPDPLPPNSPAATISASSSTGDPGSILGTIFGFTIILFFVMAVFPVMLNTATKNITSTTHTVDVPTYTPGLSIILIGGAFAMGIILTFTILRNRHRRELQRQQKLIQRPSP